MIRSISETQWQLFDEHGYVVLGQVATDQDLAALQQRIDDIMLGLANVDYDKMMMQVDTDDGEHSNLGAQTSGHKGSHLNYRKIEQLEFDPVFLRYMQHPAFKKACARMHGRETAIACHRAMFMNKPARRGTYLVWHQDAWATTFDRPPLLTAWTALDRATKENGCVQIIPGSHKRGIVNPDHGAGFLTDDLAALHCPDHDVVYLEVEAGEVALLHNFTLHRSGVNRTDAPRRAFSINYMDAATKCFREDVHHSIIFGQGALVPEELESAV